MKIFLLVITILLLFSRIKTTPEMLSKKLYLKHASNSIKKVKELMEDKNEDEAKITQGGTLLFLLLIYVLLIIYYFIIGCKFDTTMTLLSALQIATTFISLRNIRIVFDYDISKYEFHRWYFLFNVILDYIYYPMTIYLLLNS